MSGNENKKQDDDDKKIFDIIVNARPHSVSQKKASFADIVALAPEVASTGAERVYTVTYDKGPPSNPSGSMVAGDSVKLKDGMVFNVTATDKS